jgi:hypothetical protein
VAAPATCTTSHGFLKKFRPELQAHLANPDQVQGGEGFDMLKQAIVRCQAEGLAPGGDPMPLVLVAWTCVHGASALWIDGPLGNKRFVPDPETLANLLSGTVTQLIAHRA